MNAIQILSSQAWVERLGWTLVHFLWQGVLIAVLYAAVRRWMSPLSSPNARYFLGCGALAAMMAVPFVTLIFMHPSAAAPVAIHLGGRIPMDVAPAITAPVSDPTTASGEWSVHLLTWIVTIWIAGAIAFWIRLMGSWAIAAGMKSRQTRPAPPEWQHTSPSARRPDWTLASCAATGLRCGAGPDCCRLDSACRVDANWRARWPAA